ncbi:peptidase inhibitor family I36 protein [Enhygromyxa salina]|uniref:Beta/Gamma crystallin n=1 Tax=Enhygromyxa salina TaxID=215803 RepID=A0A2S9XLG2_9BACT|nr:peptidase inhibitor family I36 protein [Enhygromyxa salina]PRP93693.1 hypothetical protein ENSA7_81210 [Enhygromyxa salina]
MNTQQTNTLIRASVTAILLGIIPACDYDDTESIEDRDMAVAVEDRSLDEINIENHLNIDAVDNIDDQAVLDAQSPNANLAALGTCATMYLHIHFGGDRREIDAGAFVAWIGDLWNDEVSSIMVRSGCVLNVWEHSNFGGAHAAFQGSVPWIGNWWNDRISSYTCSC